MKPRRSWLDRMIFWTAAHPLAFTLVVLAFLAIAEALRLIVRGEP